MARTETTQIELGFTAPDFTLPDVVIGMDRSLEQLAGENGTLVMFICNHCPFVVHVRDQLIALANDYIEQGIGVIAISSNNVETHPDDAPDKMKELAEALDFPFPYLYDESQEVARAYDAACTPDFSLFDEELKCVYRGQLDGARPGNDEPNDGRDLRRAMDAMLSGMPIAKEQLPSVGCNIKWKE